MFYPIIYPPHLPTLLDNHSSWRRHKSHWKQEEKKGVSVFGSFFHVFLQMSSLSKLSVLDKVRPIYHQSAGLSAFADFACLLLRDNSCFLVAQSCFAGDCNSLVLALFICDVNLPHILTSGFPIS